MDLVQLYLPILIFFAIAFGLSLLLVALAYARAPKRPDSEKLSQYECGFEAFSDARSQFDVHYYLVAILFIIFDLEIAFLFPWAVTFKELGWVGLISVLLFLSVLTLGFFYEWRKGALEWE